MTQQAKDPSERFIAGEDRLAAVLRTLPVFEPPAAMATQFAALARAAQLRYEPVVSSASAAATPMTFEAPASLEAGFLAEAARLQAAQQPRHDAVIAQIQAGKPAAEVLGHDVTAATAAWLASRPQRIAAQAQAGPVPSGRRAAAKWWQRIGVVMASAAFGVVATNLWLAQRGDHTVPIAAALNETPAESTFVAAPASDSSQPPTVTLKVEPIAEVSALSQKRAAPGAGDSKQRVEERLREFAAEARRAAKESEADAAGGVMADKAKREGPERVQEQYAERRAEALAMASAKPAPVVEERMTAAAPPQAAPPPAAPQEGRANRQMAAAGSVAPAAPAPAMAPKIASDRADRATASLRVDLGGSPQEAAHAWAASRERAPRIFAANPEADAVRGWVERFRQALPADMRPVQIRIEQDTRLRDETLRLD